MIEPTTQAARRGCWLWTGALAPNGYGVTRDIRGRQTTAHRVSYELFVGDVPEKKIVCHSCDNPRCVRPDHLWIGTQSDNLLDMYEKGRFPLATRPERQRDEKGRYIT